MLLIIHNLPSTIRYADVKSLIKTKCGLEEVILDNLVNEGKNKKVTVGLAEEGDAALLVRKINGLYLYGQQLYVEDVRQKKASEQPYCSAKNLINKTKNSQIYDNDKYSEDNYRRGNNNQDNLKVPYQDQQFTVNQDAMPLMVPMIYNKGMGGIAMGGMYYNYTMPELPQAQNSFMDYGDQTQQLQAQVSEYPDAHLQQDQLFESQRYQPNVPQTRSRDWGAESRAYRDRERRPSPIITQNPAEFSIPRNTRWETNPNIEDQEVRRRSRSPLRGSWDSQNHFQSDRDTFENDFHDQQPSLRSRESGYGQQTPFGRSETFDSNTDLNTASAKFDQSSCFYGSHVLESSIRSPARNTWAQLRNEREQWEETNSFSSRNQLNDRSQSQRQEHNSFQPPDRSGPRQSRSIDNLDRSGPRQSRIDTMDRNRPRHSRPVTNLDRNRPQQPRPIDNLNNSGTRQPRPVTDLHRSRPQQPKPINNSNNSGPRSGRPVPNQDRSSTGPTKRASNRSQENNNVPQKRFRDNYNVTDAKRFSSKNTFSRQEKPATDRDWKTGPTASQRIIPKPVTDCKKGPTSVQTAGSKVKPSNEIPAPFNPKPNMAALLQKDQTWRSQAAAEIRREMFMNLGIMNLNQKDEIMAQLKSSIRSRIDVMLSENISVPMREIVKKYRQLYPKEGDQAFFLAVLDIINDGYDANQTKKEGTGIKPEDKSLKKAEDKYYTKPIEIASDKKIQNDYTEQLDLRKRDVEDESLYVLSPSLQKALDEEADVLCDLFMGECETPDNDEEKAICEHFTDQAADDFRKVLRLKIAKRLLNVTGDLAVRVISHGKPPRREALDAFLETRGFLIMNLHKNKMFIATTDSYKSFDALFKLGTAEVDGVTVKFKPLNLTGTPTNVSRYQSVQQRVAQIDKGNEQIIDCSTDQIPATEQENFDKDVEFDSFDSGNFVTIDELESGNFETIDESEESDNVEIIDEPKTGHKIENDNIDVQDITNYDIDLEDVNEEDLEDY